MSTELQATLAKLVTPGKGILAADESVPTITKRFKALGIESTEESRRAYRALLSTTPGIEEFVAGVILFEETLGQNADDGVAHGEREERSLHPGVRQKSERRNERAQHAARCVRQRQQASGRRLGLGAASLEGRAK